MKKYEHTYPDWIVRSQERWDKDKDWKKLKDNLINFLEQDREIPTRHNLKLLVVHHRDYGG